MILYIALAAICALIPVPSGVSLALGIAVALIWGNSKPKEIKTLSGYLLGIAVVGLGAGLDLGIVARAGIQGLGLTLFTITATMLAGYALGRWLKVSDEASILISTGTAICGGSAIAAMAPAIKAKSENISVALATVFCLNALALFLFPGLGHWFGLSQEQFGLWSALAIHDTSSVVGAAAQYGDEALKLATTYKLARALWIAPLVIAVQAIGHRGADGGVKFTRPPWFIFGFVLASALVTSIPALRPTAAVVGLVSKRVLVATLFLIGSGLTRQALRQTGLRPVVQGFALWILVSASTLALILVRIL